LYNDRYLVAGATNDGGEDGTGSIVAGKASLAHAGAVVDNQSGNLIVTHLGTVVMGSVTRTSLTDTGPVS
jgi:hypothetical protein